eukprot:tig00000158_g10210.t3
MLEPVYQFELDSELAQNPCLNFTTDATLPMPAVKALGRQVDLATNDTALAGAIFSLLSVPGDGDATSLGLVASRRPAAGVVLRGESAAETLRAPGAGDREAVCALSDGREWLFFVFGSDSDGASVSATSAATLRNFTLPSSALPRPAACAAFDGPFSLVVGTREPRLHRVRLTGDGLASEPIAWTLPSAKPVVLGERARQPPAAASRAVFLQSDDAASTGGGACNAADASVFLLVVDRSGAVRSVAGALPGLCPQALAVSPDESAALVLVAGGRLFRAPLHPNATGGLRELPGPNRIPGGGALASVIFLASRAYAVGAVVGSELAAGPRLCLLSVLEGEVAASTCFDLELPSAGVAGAAAQVALQAARPARAFYVTLGRLLVPLRAEAGSVRLLGGAGTSAQLGSSLVLEYMVGGFNLETRVKVVSAANLRTVYSFAASNPEGSWRAAGRRATAIPLRAPFFAVGGSYAVVVCLELDEACSPPGLHFKVRDAAGSDTGPARSVLLRLSALRSYVGGRLQAVLDGVSLESPVRGQSARVVSEGDAAVNASFYWNDPARWAAATKAGGPGRAVHFRFEKGPGRWRLASILAADATGELLQWVAGYNADAPSAALGSALECGALNVTLVAAGSAAPRGWLALSNFRMFAFEAAGEVDKLQCAGGESTTCFLRQNANGAGRLVASCGPAAAVPAVLRADLGAVGFAALLERASTIGGRPAALAASRRRALALSDLVPALEVFDAVDAGAEPAALIQGVAVDGADEALNPKPGSPPAGAWTPVVSAAALQPSDFACTFGPELFALLPSAVRSFGLANGAWGEGPAAPRATAGAAFACLEPTLYALGADGALMAYSSVSAEWVQLNASGEQPAPRSAAGLVATGEARLLLMGGLDGAWRALEDAWELDLALLEWRRAGAPPPQPARVGTSLAPAGTSRSVFFAFGGVAVGAASTYFDDLYRYDRDASTGAYSASRVISSGAGPSPRAHAVVQASASGGLLYVAGGLGADGPASPSELFVFDAAHSTWTMLLPLGRPPAYPAQLSRAPASAVLDGALYVVSEGAVVAWSLSRIASFPSSTGTPTAPFISAPPRAAEITSQILYPTSGAVLVAGGTVSVSWASDAAMYPRVRVELYSIDRSCSATLCAGSNAGTCTGPLPACGAAGLYQASVSLSGGPGAASDPPLLLVGDFFRLVSANVSEVLATVQPGVTVTAPLVAQERGAYAIAGETVVLEWATRGLALPHNVTVDLVESATGAPLRRLARRLSLTSSGSLSWTADLDGSPPPLRFAVTVATPSGSHSASSEEFALRPYGVEVEGPPERNWVPGGSYPLDVFSSAGVSTQLASLSLLQFPQLTHVTTVAPVLPLAAAGKGKARAGARSRGLLGAAAADRLLFANYSWPIPPGTPDGLYILQADVHSDAVSGQSPPFCIGPNPCAPGFVFRAPYAAPGALELPRLTIGRPYSIRWASAGVPRGGLVQISIANLADGKPMPIAVVENSWSFTFAPSPELTPGVYYFELSAHVDGAPVRSASTQFLLELPAAYLLWRLPDGATDYSAGDRVPLRWYLGGVGALAVALRIVRVEDGYAKMISLSAPNTGSYAWTVDGDTPPGRAAFAVASRPAVRVGSPPTDLVPGRSYRIQWSSAAVPREAAASVAVVPIASGALTPAPAIKLETTNAERELEWALPAQLVPGQYRIEVSLAFSGAVAAAGSSAPFRVVTGARVSGSRR